MTTITNTATLKDAPKFLKAIQNAIDCTESLMNVSADSYGAMKELCDEYRETEIVLQWLVSNTDMIELVKQVLPNMEF